MRRVRNNKSKIIDFPVSQEVDLNVYRRIPVKEMAQISCSRDINEFVRKDWENINHVETMKAIFMNKTNRIIGTKIVSIGGIDLVMVDIRVVFQAALLCNASYFILAHNHPSGNLIPSTADHKITSEAKDCGRILHIPLIDHVIIADEGYYSFADNGIF